MDIKNFIDERPISAYQWILVATCFLVVVADGMDVAIMGFVTPSILQEWDISRPAFGVVISAAPFGLVIGALVAGPSSDSFGRKIVLIVSVLLFGVFTLVAAYASSPTEMAILRLLAGMGMGAAMPNGSTLLSEYAPQRRRSLMITVMFTGFNLGSAAIGLLFSRGYGVTTISLWVTYFMGLLVIYLLTGWPPTLMKDAGLSISTAANVTAMFQIGGTIGAIIVGWTMDKARPAFVIGTAYLCGALCIVGVSLLGVLSPVLAALIFSAGFCMSGAQTGLNAFAPGCYPTVARATGVSRMLGIGRFGSILGSAVGGALLGSGWGFDAILAMLAVPAVCAAVAITMTRLGSVGAAPKEAAAH